MATTRGPAGRRTAVGIALFVAILAAAGTLGHQFGWFGTTTRAPATYVGRAACAECHQAEMATFAGSHHDLAMQPATPATVLGDFGGTSFSHFGVTSTFSRAGEQFVVRTDGPNGELRDYPVAYVFGVTPLQQYLLDIGKGRLQALTIAWDSRPKDQGGQRWFHLYPDERLPAGDELHWAGIQQNWNFMCAECHSTNLRRGYDAASDTFHTTWSEIDASCESCHGPASWHVGWANGESVFRDLGSAPGKGLVVSYDARRGATWSNDPKTGLPVRSKPMQGQKELDACARCHSRRSTFEEDFVPGRPLLDTHWPSLLTEGLFHKDGQLEGEVYNYQSFLQSRMAQAGVTCSDCHEPHTGKTRGLGNVVCMQCHEPRFDTAAHHFHAPGSAGAQCTACHAPTVTYMGVDPRHDHSFRVPRPDLSSQHGVPNACTSCHQDQQPAWATAKLKEWYGRLRTDRTTWTGAFAAARANRPDAAKLLLDLASDERQPGIVRATALHELSQPLDRAAAMAVLRVLNEADPLLRWSAANVLADSAPELHGALRILLDDPVRAVRMAAARGLVNAPTADWTAAQVAARDAGLAEYVAAQRLNADRPESHMNLGNLARDQGNTAAAEAEFRAALRLHPQFLAAYVNLADLYRETTREADCERTLREGVALTPQSGELLHALGLCLVRQKKLEDGVPVLGQAVRASPTEPRFAYVYAIALESVGRPADAVTALAEACARLPEDRDLLELQVEYLAKQDDLARAREKALDYIRRWPDTEAAQRWREGLLK